MFFFSWRRWLQRMKGMVRGQSRPVLRAPRFQPRIEWLEERSLPSFTPVAGSPIAVSGGPPVAIKVADVNGDGKPDLILANYDNPPSISVLLGNGSGGFTAAPGSPISTGNSTYPHGLAVGDVNGDGKPDIVTANYYGNVSVLLGNGSGGFTPAPGSPVSTGAPNYPRAFSVALGDINGDGKLDAVVANYNSSTVSVLLGNGNGTFTPASGSPISLGGSQPRSVALADLNGDGKLDIVTADEGSNNISVLLGNGNGTFAAPVLVPTGGSGPRSVVVADVNGDGKPDLVVGNYNSGNVSVQLGNGSGGFTAAANSPFATAGSSVSSVAVADVNGDGKPDIIASNYSSGTVSVLVGNGAGNFTLTTDTPVSTGSHAYSVAVADVNGDGRPDIITANRYNYNVSVLLNDATPTGTGFFAPASASPTATGAAPHGVAVADLNGDGKPDIVTANQGANNVSVLLSNGSGGFTAAPGSPVATGGTAPVAVVAADVNADGKPDLIVANSTSNNVSILLGNGSGGFTLSSMVATGGTDPVALAVGDVNGDGKPDIVVADKCSNNVSIMMVNCSGRYTNSSTVSVVTATNAIALVDVNGDGILDLVTTNYGSNNVSVLLGNGNGTFTAASGSPLASGGTGPDALAVADVNNDGRPDLVSGNFTSNNVSVLLGNGNGTFTPASGSPVASGGTGPDSVGVLDVNGDGKPDIIVANSTSNNVSVLLGNGTGTFTVAAGSPVASGGTSPSALVVADVTRDARPDIIVANAGSNTVSVLVGSGSGSFTPTSSSPLGSGGSNPAVVAVGDVNGDGIPDLVVGNYNSQNVSILLGNGAGGFTLFGSPINTNGGAGPYSIVLADVNGDGKLDILVGNYSNNNVSVLLGNGNGTFQTPIVVNTGGATSADIAVGDLNGDGKPDLVVGTSNANSGTTNVSVLLGNGNGTFGAPTLVNTGGTNSFGVALADLNGDGKLDIVSANSGSNNVSVLLGNGAGGFAAPILVPTGGTTPRSVAIGDANGDGKPDIIVGNEGSNNVSVLLGNGSRRVHARHRFAFCHRRRGRGTNRGGDRCQRRRQTRHRHGQLSGKPIQQRAAGQRRRRFHARPRFSLPHRRLPPLWQGGCRTEPRRHARHHQPQLPKRQHQRPARPAATPPPTSRSPPRPPLSPDRPSPLRSLLLPPPVSGMTSITVESTSPVGPASSPSPTTAARPSPPSSMGPGRKPSPSPTASPARSWGPPPSPLWPRP